MTPRSVSSQIEKTEDAIKEQLDRIKRLKKIQAAYEDAVETVAEDETVIFVSQKVKLDNPKIKLEVLTDRHGQIFLKHYVTLGAERIYAATRGHLSQREIATLLRKPVVLKELAKLPRPAINLVAA